MDGRREDGDGDAQRMQLDEHVAGASSSGDGAAHSVTETSPQQPQAGAASDATTQPMLPSQENRSTVGPLAAENSVSVSRARPTDATLTLRYATRVRLTEHLDGRLAVKGVIVISRTL